MCENKEGGNCCAGHGMGWGHKSWLCWLIGAIVLVVVFCAGYKLGMLKAYLGGWGYEGGYGRPMMLYRNGYGDGYGYGPGMMGNWRYADDEHLQGQVTTTLPAGQK